MHLRNAAERAIQTLKNHFLSGISMHDPNFPIKEWDRLLPQCNITLNLLRSSRRQPNLPSYAATLVKFNFNQTPLAPPPPGTRVLVHKTTKQRASFAPHGVDGWYIGPSLDHYWCYNCYIPLTASTCNAISVDWFPHQIPFPKVTMDDYLTQTAKEILALIRKKLASNRKKHPLAHIQLKYTKRLHRNGKTPSACPWNTSNITCPCTSTKSLDPDTSWATQRESFSSNSFQTTEGGNQQSS